MSTTKKITVRARALKNGNANFISMVDRGANRLPVQALKNEDKNMFDLDNIFRRQKKERDAAIKNEVVALLVPADQTDGYVTAMKQENPDQDLHVFTVEGKEHVSVISLKSEEETDLSQALIFQGGEDAPAVAVSGAQKMLHDWGYDSDQGFAGSVISNGFYSNARSACDVFMSALFDTMEKAEDNPTEAVNSLVTEFGSYMTSLVANVPAQAFKYEQLRPVTVEPTQDEHEEQVEGATAGEAAKSEPVVEGEVVNANPETTVNDEPKGDAAKSEPKEDSEGEDPTVTDENEAPKDTVAKTETNDDATAQLIAALGTLPEAISQLTETVTGLKSELESVKGDVATAKETATKAESKAKENEDALNTVVIEPDDGREDNALKSEVSEDRKIGRNANVEYY